jgi:hypothetical protein
MRNSNKLVLGIGINDNKHCASKGGKITKEYSLWSNMLLRNTKEHWVKYPSYEGTTCSENFKSYTFFYEWCQKQVGFGNKDDNGKSWCLDKDLLVRGNSIYSEDTCAFIPHRINMLVSLCSGNRGEYFIGVSWNKHISKFNAHSSCGSGKNKSLGYFNTPQEAFLAYKTFKEALIKQVANEYKEQLDPRVYEALMNYEVNEND